MPRLDGTGPLGQGPRTGRGFGNCLGVNRRGVGRGLGWGVGRFSCFTSKTLTKDEQRKVLEEEKKIIEEEIAKLNV